MKWTKEQREAIEYSGKNILLAAAAGSGKTAVLVQRIIEMISDPERNININELLVLTFTDAAAREMREKIADAIIKTLEENPESEHLQRQKLLLHSASISTVHSFCLNILKSNIHLTDLPVGFSLASETENKLILGEALDEVLERFYGRIDRDTSIAQLVMGYGGIKNDSSLRETVLGLFYFSKSMAYPAKWLNAAVREYRDTAARKSLKGGLWQQDVDRITAERKKDILDIYNEILLKIDEQLTPDHPYAAFFSEEAASLRRTFEHMAEGDYTASREAVFRFEFSRLVSGPRGAEGDMLAAQEYIKALRELAKGIVGDLWELYKTEEDELIRRIVNTYPILRTLKNIVLMLDRRYTRKKREKNLLDFGDLEHEALKLLAGRDGQPTQAAMTLKKKYKEILVDEYQDTNNIQDTLFKTLSANNSNVFMVGDLKQSIYSFRNAVPKLFSDKYADYQKTDSCGHLIRLFKNFRSRRQVVNTVNFVFRCIMSPDVGDVDYTEDEYLIRGAEYPDGDDEARFDTEFHLICSNNSGQEGAEPRDKSRLEAYVAASRIREMIDGKMQVFDKRTGELRPVKYSDIVVLMRNTKTPAPIFEEVFGERGIPVYTEVGKSYLNSPEVRTVLAFLQIIDNPRQDIPLIAVMRSPVWGFSPDELAEIRCGMRHGCFFDAVENAAEKGNTKAAEFVAGLSALRENAKYTGVEGLIRCIYYDYGYYGYSGVLSRGAERQANLRLLFERAAEFEHTQLSGLFGFMSYIETIKAQGDDLTPAKSFGDGDNAVRIMTIHKSKGLEFPVVILSDTTRDFNMTDIQKSILWHGSAGLAAEYTDAEMRVRYPSLPAELVKLRAKGELMSEEMRLLYVALTRAREKLIVTATFKQTKKGLPTPVLDRRRCAKLPYIKTKRSFRDWLMAAFVTHPGAKAVREHFGFGEGLVNTDADFDFKAVVYADETQIPVCGGETAAAETSELELEAAYGDELFEKVMFEYPNAYLAEIPVKLSVSEAKRMQAEEEEVPLLDDLKTAEMMELKALSPAERGTVTHFVLQLIGDEKTDSVDDVYAFAERLEKDGIITAQQRAAVDCRGIFGFLISDLGKRMKKASRVEREFSFYTKAEASELFENGGAAEVLLQGTMDCFFVDADGRLVLIDFKTDKVFDANSAKKRSEKYRVQMKYYKQALAEIVGRSVDEGYLYFLSCGEAVEV